MSWVAVGTSAAGLAGSALSGGGGGAGGSAGIPMGAFTGGSVVFTNNAGLNVGRGASQTQSASTSQSNPSDGSSQVLPEGQSKVLIYAAIAAGVVAIIGVTYLIAKK